MSEAPSPSITFAGIPLNDSKQSSLGDNGSPPSDSNSNSNSPQESPSPPSPDSSSTDSPPAPPPDDSSSSSPPSDSTTPPPSNSDTPSNSPPPDSNSNSSPPSDSGTPPSPDSNSDSSQPPQDSGSSKSPPPSGTESPPPPPPPPTDSNSSPPSSEGSNPSPPPDSPVTNPPPSDQSSSPPPDKTPSTPNSPPKESSPPPKESNASPPTPTQLPNTPTTAHPPPQPHDSPPAPTSRQNPPANDTLSMPIPPGSRASQHAPELTPPSIHSLDSSTPPWKSSGSSTGGTVAGATVAGFVIIAFVAIFFVIARKKKRREHDYPDHFGPPPNFSGPADGYYYGHHSQQHSLPHSQPHSQQHSIGISGQSNEFYSGPSAIGNGYGSYRGTPESGVIAGGMSSFSYEELMGITNGFSRQNVIGEGGFGSVYKGYLSDGRAVAVKELKAGSGQGEREFRAEVDIISRVHHRHLVSLVGYCVADRHRLLVYEFVSNNNLEHHLHGEGMPVMEWSKRIKIAVGSARGLAYLHEDCHPKIIHRDIKSANILLDDVFEAQVADFGLAKLSNDTNTHVSTRVMGTFGYLAPEYAASGKLSDRSDVFSFGVVLLELVTGRKPVDGSQPLGDESLVEWARPILAHALETRDFSEIVDPRLENRYVEDEMVRMISAASACVRHSAPKRPRMVQVLRALDTDSDMPDLTNGVKVGQSTIFESGQYSSDIQKFRMMALSEDSSEFQMYSGNQTSGEIPRKPQPGDAGAVEFPSGESETRAMNPRSNRRY